MLRANVRKVSEFYTKTNISIGLCSGCVATLLARYFISSIPWWGLVLFFMIAVTSVIHHLASADEINESRKELQARLEGKSKEYLVSYSQSPELKLGEREVALDILNEKYPGWSLSERV